ncbi:hypothetical protein [Flavobacterium cellulosilyticum]|uniref:Uncharacterized protein n=1 Tax=Flavobacterium cellulosilyticum TaxID=2541731 RepID=A0A4R5C3V6_9FLAO|nr:hypothetical protein [Flavobacterium cellulosilyticum]TDD93605.1 hypothetical protein E0F76_18840 [Flavobacterium cellulosilyticum]
MKNEINEVLQKRIENEKKQKRVTIITATFFCAFAIIIIYLGNYANMQKKEIASKNRILDSISDRLKSANSILKQDTLTLKRTADNYDAIQKQLANLQKATSVNSNSVSIGNSNKNTDAKYNDQVESVKLAVNNNNYKSLSKTSAQNYTLYIQYMEAFPKLSAMLKTAFLEEKYTIAKEQNMGEISFPSSVRYFYKTDKERAGQIAKKAEATINKKFKVQFMKLKSPQNQIEIWVGR